MWWGRGWMLRGFGGSLSFESDYNIADGGVDGKGAVHEGEREGWSKERKVKIRIFEGEEGELGDSCCFGTRTVQGGRDCAWKLHGGV